MKREFVDGLPQLLFAKWRPKNLNDNEVFHKLDPSFRPSQVTKSDGGKSHSDYEIVEAASRNVIAQYRLPANTTYMLRPFDKAVF